MAPLLVTAVLYARGMARLRRRSLRRPARRRMEAMAFWAGWAVLALALLSPLHRLGEVLLSAHMAQHELLMIVAAPLLVLGRPWIVSLWGMPAGWRPGIGAWVGRIRPLWRLMSRLDVAWLLHAVAVLAWHVPALYQRTVDSVLVHSLQHGSFLLTALIFWWAVLIRAPVRSGHGPAIIALFSTMVYTGGLGALLTLGQSTWYPGYGDAAPAWGLSPLEDQQLAGLLMWVPGGLSYLVATLWLTSGWLRASENRVRSLVSPVTVGTAGALQDRT